MEFDTKFREFSNELRQSTTSEAVASAPPRLYMSSRRLIASCAVLTVVAGFLIVRGALRADHTEAPVPASTATVIDAVPTPPAAPAVVPPSVSVKALLISELQTGLSLYEVNSAVRWPLASVTKLVTAAVALEQLGADEHIPMTESAVASEGISGNFRPGETYTSRDLIAAMMTVSSNDAATALAEFYDGAHMLKNQPADASGSSAPPAGVPISKTAYFTEAMGKFAKRIGMRESVFGDPTGLSPINQTTVGDLAILVRYIATQHPDIFIPSRRKTNIITELTTNRQKELININKFAGREDFVGGKTGFTDEAQGNLVSIFSYNGTEYVIAVLGTEKDRFAETLTALNWLKQQNP